MCFKAIQNITLAQFYNAVINDKSKKSICNKLGISSLIFLKILKRLELQQGEIDTQRFNINNIQLLLEQKFSKIIANCLDEPLINFFAPSDFSLASIIEQMKKNNITKKKLCDNLHFSEHELRVFLSKFAFNEYLYLPLNYNSLLERVVVHKHLKTSEIIELIGERLYLHLPPKRPRNIASYLPINNFYMSLYYCKKFSEIKYSLHLTKSTFLTVLANIGIETQDKSFEQIFSELKAIIRDHIAVYGWRNLTWPVNELYGIYKIPIEKMINVLLTTETKEEAAACLNVEPGLIDIYFSNYKLDYIADRGIHYDFLINEVKTLKQLKFSYLQISVFLLTKLQKINVMTSQKDDTGFLPGLYENCEKKRRYDHSSNAEDTSPYEPKLKYQDIHNELASFEANEAINTTLNDQKIDNSLRSITGEIITCGFFSRTFKESNDACNSFIEVCQDYEQNNFTLDEYFSQQIAEITNQNEEDDYFDLDNMFNITR